MTGPLPGPGLPPLLLLPMTTLSWLLQSMLFGSLALPSMKPWPNMFKSCPLMLTTFFCKLTTKLMVLQMLWWKWGNVSLLWKVMPKRLLLSLGQLVAVALLSVPFPLPSQTTAPAEALPTSGFNRKQRTNVITCNAHGNVLFTKSVATCFFNKLLADKGLDVAFVFDGNFEIGKNSLRLSKALEMFPAKLSLPFSGPERGQMASGYHLLSRTLMEPMLGFILMLTNHLKQVVLNPSRTNFAISLGINMGVRTPLVSPGSYAGRKRGRFHLKVLLYVSFLLSLTMQLCSGTATRTSRPLALTKWQCLSSLSLGFALSGAPNQIVLPPFP